MKDPNLKWNNACHMWGQRECGFLSFFSSLIHKENKDQEGKPLNPKHVENPTPFQKLFFKELAFLEFVILIFTLEHIIKNITLRNTS